MKLSFISKKYLRFKKQHTHLYTPNNSINFLKSGEEFFKELEKLILNAKYSIHLQTYIFEIDIVGLNTIDLLIKKANDGVKVFLYVDAYGSSGFPKNMIQKLRAAGIYFKYFSPIHTSLKFRIGRRLHHKILLVDEHIALVGGINIAEKYKGNSLEKPWLDFAVKIKGDVCKDILIICESVLGRQLRKKIKNLKTQFSIEEQSGNISAKLLQNDWLRRKVEISTFYRQQIRHAQHSITIVASYFLPGMRLRKLLKKASQRGVKITFVLPGRSDVGLLKQATNYIYPFLLRYDMTLFEWEPSIMHGKLMIVDELITTVGSYNLNALSDYGSLELNIAVKDEEFAAQVQQSISDLITKDCKKIIRPDYEKQHHWWNQFINWISFQTLRISLRLLFLFMRK